MELKVETKFTVNEMGLIQWPEHKNKIFRVIELRNKVGNHSYTFITIDQYKEQCFWYLMDEEIEKYLNIYILPRPKQPRINLLDIDD